MDMSMDMSMDTSMDTSRGSAIVVGVTGRGQETAALRFAAECARREGAEVVLAHAFHAARPAPPVSPLLAYPEAADLAHRLVNEVGEEFEELTRGEVALRTVTLAGRPARILVHLSRGARMVVVQHRDSHDFARLFVGSTANGTAARADCPVVSVPMAWQPGEVPGEVVVGVHEGGGPRQVLEAGFAWADATGAPLRIVHAWRLDAAYDDLVTAAEAAHWRDEQKAALASAVAGLRERHPTVQVILEVRHQWPSDVLVDDSQVASLVVVGRHGSHGWAPEHLGSVTRTVLRAAKSPVMVVPLDRRDTSEDWGLVADEVSPQT